MAACASSVGEPSSVGERERRSGLSDTLRRQPEDDVAVALARPAIALEAIEPPRLEPNVAQIPLVERGLVGHRAGRQRELRERDQVRPSGNGAEW
jgi:hypothetical protein